MSEYIGRRIVPAHGGVWEKEKSYEELIIVLDTESGNSYISRRPVPAGTAISDRNYWMLYSLYSAQIGKAEQHLSEAEEDVKNRIAASEKKVADELAATEKKVADGLAATEQKVTDDLAATEKEVELRTTSAERITNTNKSELTARMDGIEKRLDANLSASTEPDADYAAELVDARVADDETVYPTLGTHLRALDAGKALQQMDAKKVIMPDFSVEKIYHLAVQKGSSSFELSYDPAGDSMRIACVADYPGDYIIYVPVLNARDYAKLGNLGKNLLVRYRTSGVVNGGRSFKYAFWLSRVTDPESTSVGSIFGNSAIHVFQNGGEDNEDVVRVVRDDLEYDPELRCYVRDGKPVNLLFLLYANSPKAGEELTISGRGGLLYGYGENGEMTALGLNMLRADLKKRETQLDDQFLNQNEKLDAAVTDDSRCCRTIPFAPTGVFAPSNSLYETIEDEEGDMTYHISYVDNNPMYQMPLNPYLEDSCREIIVELTARLLSEQGQLRVQLYDSANGMNHVPGATGFDLTPQYRKYQFRIGRRNAGNTTLGIGPRIHAGTEVQFKNVKILIPNEMTKQVPFPVKHFFGYVKDTDFSELEEVYLKEPILAGTDDYAKRDGLYLDTVELYSTQQRGVTFHVGCIDQFGLFQERSSFSAIVRKGRNYLKFDDLKIAVPAGYGVFASWDAAMAVFKKKEEITDEPGNDVVTEEAVLEQADAESSAAFHNLISTKSDYFENEEGYSGYPLTENPYIVPMRFTLSEKMLPVKLDEVWKSVSNMGAETGDLKERVELLEQESGTDVSHLGLTDPEGVKYHFTVGADGTLFTIRSIPKKAVVFGNSLTLGFGTFGMAASDSSHDYYHYVREYLRGLNPEAEVERYAGSSWEGMTDSVSRISVVNGFLEKLSGGEDLVIIQLSDNVNTPEKKATYPEDVRTMLTMFRKHCPKARILWVAAWYGWSVNYAPIEEAGRELGIDLVDIRDLSSLAENQNKLGNTYTSDDGTVHEIVSGGVASHPGDLGMKRIAERIIKKLESYL